MSLELFTAGLAIGSSRCLLFCIPILMPYIAGSGSGWKKALQATLVFSFARLCSYALLGLLAGVFAGTIDVLKHPEYVPTVWKLAGTILVLLGIFIVLGKELRIRPCRFFFRHFIDRAVLSMALLGFLVAISPCPFLLGVLAHIALVSPGAISGAFYGLSFGLGTAIVTPILGLGVLAGAFRYIFKTPQIYLLFSRVCGFLLVLSGIRFFVY